MDGLLPIIRRVRHPLLPPEAPADVKSAVVPAEAEPAAGGRVEVREDRDGKAAASESAE